MQLVANGPDIPDALLQAHEEGRVVFFCGAGISYPAGLPGFKDLVDEIFRFVGTTPNAIEQVAYEHNQFDASIDLLERRLPGQGRLAVRKALMKVLQPNLRRKGAADTHTALLQLARNREGALRLVTTNFDRIFEWVAKCKKQPITTYAAPLLPIPKISRWNGLVYLHGLLPEQADDSALNRLVLSSGDFGLAYLIERWASRFVSELFRNYVVCFVGYSINDPVLRYMMDALAADRALGEVTPQAYALGDCESGQEDAKIIEWKAKGVVPILYEVPTGTHDYSAFHRTLKIWAEIYRDGILGKERIVVDYAKARPSASTQQDDFVGRMLWALSDKSGLPAKRFAEFNPTPPVEWLEAFSDERCCRTDLTRFGVLPHAEMDVKLSFSLVRRPAPTPLAPWMTLVSAGPTDSQWDVVMFHLARWLVRHLDNPELILWLVQRGGQLHERLVLMIENELDTFVRFEREDKTDDLERIRSRSPNAIPRPLLCPVWRLLLTNQVKTPRHNHDLYRWKDRLMRDGLTTSLRFQLRELLTPKVALRKPFLWGEDGSGCKNPEHLKQLIDWELVLATDNVHTSLLDLANAASWHAALPVLLEDFQQLLRDALDILHDLGEADDRSDRSHLDLSSISPHWQNRGFRDWVTLIELLRDAWLTVREVDLARATMIAQDWFALPYSTFKRLALFAASHYDCIPPDQWVDWLLADEAWWLWSFDTMRETLRLFVQQGHNLTLQAQSRLETAILAGPPRTMFRDDLDPESWQNTVDRLVWLRLAKLKSSGGQLGMDAAHRLDVLSPAHPEWCLSENEREEFSRWIGTSGDPGFRDSRVVDIAPRKRSELVKWLKSSPPSPRPFYEDTWRETCSTRFFHCAFALFDLSQEGDWPSKRWDEALLNWSREGLVQRSWQFIAPLAQTMPDEKLKEIAHSIASWLEATSKSFDRHEDILLVLCRRILALPHENEEDFDRPVDRAINHPIGLVTQTLLNVWFKRKPNDNDKLSADLEPVFTKLCDTNIKQFRHGRVLLASNLIALFRVDRPWTETHLLPLFNWTIATDEARAAWEGFFWSPRLYPALFMAFKTQFLASAHHYKELGEHARQFATVLTYAALETVDTYSVQDFQAALARLPQEGLDEAAHTLVQVLEGAGEQREDYWINRMQPFWQNTWPKYRERSSISIAESLALLCIAARGKFPNALTTVIDWLQPFDRLHYMVHQLHESGLSKRFPEEALCFLDTIIKNQLWAPPELHKCLDDIKEGDHKLTQDNRYKRLVLYLRQHGI